MGITDKISRFFSHYTFDPIRCHPKTIYIELTGACNLSCPNCPRTFSEHKRGHMQDDLFYTIITNISKVFPDVKHIGFHFFGEIELKSNFDILVRWARTQLPNVDFGVATTLSLPPSDTLKKLILSGFNSIAIWPDGFSKESYSEIRTGGDYFVVKENIRLLLESRKSLNMQNISVYVGMVENRLNTNYIKQFYNEFEFVNRYINTELVTVKSHDWAGQISADNVLKTVSNYKIKIPKPCSYVLNNMIVAANGDVSLCCYDMNLEMSIGNITKDGSLDNIWGSKRAQQIRRQMKFFNPPALCKRCHNFYLEIGAI